MILTRNPNCFHCLLATLALLIAVIPFAAAQTSLAGNPVAGFDTTNPGPDIPTSPGSLLSTSNSSSPPESDPSDPGTGPVFKHSPHLHMTVFPGEIADPMTVSEKVRAGLKNSVSLFSMTGWIASAGYEQMTNGSPNFGTDAGAFGERLGFGAIHGISNGVFSNSLFAPIFHEDPRYYVMGPGHPFLKRLVYAGTRVLITRTDSGHSTPNFALFAGNAASSALTVTYYPAKNATFSGVAETFGGSLGGSVLGFVVDEFLADALKELHLKRKGQQR